MSDLCGGCFSNRLKDLIFWSIQKATYDSSGYGRERELVTQELFQAVYSLISDRGEEERGGSLVDFGLLILKHESYDKKWMLLVVFYTAQEKEMTWILLCRFVCCLKLKLHK